MVLLRSGTIVFASKDEKPARKNTKQKVSSKTKSESSKILDDLIDDEESSEEEYSSDEDLWMEQDYERDIPKSIKTNVKLTNSFNRLARKIKKKEPTIEMILESKIRMKRKLYLMEKFYIYKLSTPYSEERYYLKKELLEKLNYYQKEYDDFRGNKDKFISLEKNQENDSDLMNIKKMLLNLETSEKNLQILSQKFSLLESRSSFDDEYYKNLNWVRLCLNIPFTKIKPIPYMNHVCKFLEFLRAEMDRELYGMEEAKEKILLYVHNRILNPLTQNFPLALLGKPGLGKTSIATLLSRVLQIPFQQINMGGVSSPEFFLGFDSCYVGSKPGRIAKALIQSEYKNTILFFDEFDKCESKEVINCMLHITDSSQNHHFHDNYFGEIDIDLSSCWFIMSMNNRPEDKALDDRMSYVQIPEYTEKDKLQILKNYLIPRALDDLTITQSDIVFTDEVILFFIQKVNPELSGIRLIKQKISDIISKIIFLVRNPNIKTTFSLPPKYKNKLQFPFVITTDIIEILLQDMNRNQNQSFMQMYL